MCAEINEGALEGFQLEPRVWDLVQSHCPLEEAAEVRRILGSSLVEQSLDLYEEVTVNAECFGGHYLELHPTGICTACDLEAGQGRDR